MASLGNPINLPPLSYSGNWRESAHEKAFKALEDAQPAEGIKGCIIKFSVADGYAHYLVKSDSPLVLQWINYGDGYRVHDAMIRGLEKADVEQMVARDRYWTRKAKEYANQ